MAADTPVPTDDEIDALIAQHWPAFATVGSIPLQGLRAAFRDGLARWGAQPAPAASPAPRYLPPLITAQINHLRNTAYRDGKDGEPSGLLDRVHERLGAIILVELAKARQHHGIKTVS